MFLFGQLLLYSPSTPIRLIATFQKKTFALGKLGYSCIVKQTFLYEKTFPEIIRLHCYKKHLNFFFFFGHLVVLQKKDQHTLYVLKIKNFFIEAIYKVLFKLSPDKLSFVAVVGYGKLMLRQ